MRPARWWTPALVAAVAVAAALAQPTARDQQNQAPSAQGGAGRAPRRSHRRKANGSTVNGRITIHAFPLTARATPISTAREEAPGSPNPAGVESSEPGRREEVCAHA